MHRTATKVCLVRRDAVLLNARLDLRNHSPDGFNWGYAGSGPAQLALALVADAIEDDTLAQECYQAFKLCVVANEERNHWELTDEWIQGWVVCWRFLTERHRAEQ